MEITLTYLALTAILSISLSTGGEVSSSLMIYFSGVAIVIFVATSRLVLLWIMRD